MSLDRNLFLKGETICLRPLQMADLEGNYRYWLNDAEIVQYNSHGRFPMTEAKLAQYINAVQQADSMLVLAIIDIQTEKHIGNISLQSISWVDRSAEIAFLLGEKDFWGKGVMYEAGRMIIAHGFDTLNLHRIYCGTSSENTGMQKLALKLNMQQEGVRKEAIYKNGNYCDIIEYGILNKK